MNIEHSKLLEAVLALSGDEKLFVRIGENDSKRLRFLYFRKNGLDNAVLSYINSTNELANELNFTKFVDKIANITIELEEIKESILRGYLPEDLANYLLSPLAEHSYLIDNYNDVIILSRNESSNDSLHTCEKHIPGQEHVHNEKCETNHDHDHNHGHHNHNHTHDHAH